MVGLGSSHPELVRRYNALVAACWTHGYEVWISSSSRSRATQEDLYRRWLAGTYRVPSVANPNGDHGPSPWGWRWKGSYHMPQQDGFSHALDMGWRGCTPAEFEQLCNQVGLQRTVPKENWHYQWVNRQVIFPAPGLTAPPPPIPVAPITSEEDDMKGMQIIGDDGGVFAFFPGGVVINMGGKPQLHVGMNASGVAPVVLTGMPAGELADFAAQWQASV